MKNGKEVDLHLPRNYTRRDFIKGLGVALLYPNPEKKEVSFSSSVLYYHEVKTRRLYSDVMDLVSRGFQPLSLDDFTAIINDKADPPSDSTFLITLDDGLLSQFTQGLPAIDAIEKETGIFVPLTFFTIMGFLGLGDKTLDEMPDDTPAFEDRYHRYMTKAQLIELLNLGHNVQNHTVLHPNLTKLNSEDMSNEIKWGDSRTDEVWKAAGIKRKSKAFAYPFGALGRREQGYLTNMGYDVAFSTFATTDQNSSRRLRLGRLRKT